MFHNQVNRTIQDTLPGVCVIILTKNRYKFLKRAVTSVSKQKFQPKLQVLIVGDNCSYIKPQMFSSDFPEINFQYVNIINDISNETSTLKRIAKLRNAALSIVKTELVTFLDDDNQWTPEHLLSLYQTMLETKCPAVHSWRVLVNKNNKQVIVNSFPWLSNQANAIERFNILTELGIMSRKSAVVRDTHEAIYKNIDYGMVDCGEWLFHRTLIQHLKFQTEFSVADEINMVGEDDKLLQDLKKFNAPIASTQTPTLLYTLGGMSNKHDS